MYICAINQYCINNENNNYDNVVLKALFFKQSSVIIITIKTLLIILLLISIINYELLPSVCMYSTLRHGIGKPSVRCNFAGPFQHPLEGYEGYGADLNMETRRQSHK